MEASVSGRAARGRGFFLQMGSDPHPHFGLAAWLLMRRINWQFPGCVAALAFLLAVLVLQ
jgi:hypothetical protein